LVPYKQERALLDKHKLAREEKDREAIKAHRDSLVAFYVFYGESYKGSDKPDPRSAKSCLKKALNLQIDHPVANYRYAHLVYGEQDFTLAAFHFKLALDGTREQSLNDTQTLIAQIIIVNCGLSMAREAIKEVDYLQNNEHASFDRKLKDNYLDQMLVYSEDLQEHFMYMKETESAKEPISEEQFHELQETSGDSDVLLCITPTKRELVYRGRRELLTQTEFFVVHTVMQSKKSIKVKEIHDTLFEGHPLEEVVTHAAVRQCLHRLSSRIAFWEMVVETETRGNYSVRRRGAGISYTFLYHSSIVLP
jgi:hypothetical protein